LNFILAVARTPCKQLRSYSHEDRLQPISLFRLRFLIKLVCSARLR